MFKQILDIPIYIITSCVEMLNSVEIIEGVSLWTFTIVLFIVTAFCSVFFRSGKS